MRTHKERLIYHIDVNSAYLSFEAVYRLQHGSSVDLRDIPSAVGGDPTSRHGIILAKSQKCKPYNVQTGEPIFQAKRKCADHGVDLTIVPPNMELYLQCSNNMVEIFRSYTDKVQRYSIDECFLDMTNMEYFYPDPVELGYEIKERIKKELGFCVSVGISSNKLLAKMASEFGKDSVHTLFPNEIKEKMWSLPIRDLFGVGPKTEKKLLDLNITKVGDLATYDIDIIKNKFKSYGLMIWKYANGIEDSDVRKSNFINMKGMGNSCTISFDVEDMETAHLVLLSLSETVGMRLRNSENLCDLISIHIRYSDFTGCSKQRKLHSPTDITSTISANACCLFDEVWKELPVRHLGVSVSHLSNNEYSQVSLFDEINIEKKKKLDKSIDEIRFRYGNKSVVRGCFLNSGIRPLSGGTGNDDFPQMSSIL